MAEYRDSILTIFTSDLNCQIYNKRVKTGSSSTDKIIWNSENHEPFVKVVNELIRISDKICSIF